jgi:queuine tRNA-ribosyltransferase
MFDFRLEAKDGAARAGTFTTPHGEVRTPAFMPVGTAGTVKALSPDEVAELGARMVLANTYHLDSRYAMPCAIPVAGIACMPVAEL